MNNFKISHHSSRKARKQVGDYILEKAIGFGAFSTVYEGTNVQSKEKVAVKSINLHRINVSEKHLSNLKQEIDILRKCRHRNIVQLLHTYQTSNHIYLIMQYCGGGDLHRFVQRNGKMNEIHAQRFSIQLMEGLKYLHSLKIIHRDLKPQNILLSNNSSNAIVRIADFGFARYKPTGHNMVDTMCGSPLYMAPEILKFNKYDSKVDLWSAGTIIYQMVTKEPPFNGANHIELLKKIENCKHLRFPPGLSDNCKDLIIRLLKRNPIQRISWDSFFKHSWLNPASSGQQRQSSFGNNNSNTSTPRTRLNHTVPTPYDYAESDNNNTDRTPTPRVIKSNHSDNNTKKRESINNNKQRPKPLQIVNRTSPTNGTPEAFIMIDNGANSANSSRQHSMNNTPKSMTTTPKPIKISMNSKIYMEFLNKCMVTFSDVSIKYEYVKCIMKVGDVQTSREQISCALLLYLRGLDILEDIIISIQTWIQVYTASYKYYHSKFKNKRNKEKLLKDNNVSQEMSQTKLDEYSVKYKQLLLDSISCYDDHWKRGEAIQTLCATEHLQFDLNRVNIDEVIFYFAINIAKKSCSDVILNIDQNVDDEYKENKDENKEQEMDDIENQNSSRNKVKQAKLLLDYLMTLDSIENDDKKQIQKYVTAVDNTLRVIENL